MYRSLMNALQFKLIDGNAFKNTASYKYFSKCTRFCVSGTVGCLRTHSLNLNSAANARRVRTTNFSPLVSPYRVGNIQVTSHLRVSYFLRPYFNMVVEDYFFNKCVRDFKYFEVKKYKPTVIVGTFVNISELFRFEDA